MPLWSKQSATPVNYLAHNASKHFPYKRMLITSYHNMSTALTLNSVHLILTSIESCRSSIILGPGTIGVLTEKFPRIALA